MNEMKIKKKGMKYQMKCCVLDRKWLEKSVKMGPKIQLCTIVECLASQKSFFYVSF